MRPTTQLRDEHQAEAQKAAAITGRVAVAISNAVDPRIVAPPATAIHTD